MSKTHTDDALPARRPTLHRPGDDDPAAPDTSPDPRVELPPADPPGLRHPRDVPRRPPGRRRPS